jgi:hypothetical protein
MNKSRRMEWEEHVTRVGNNRNVYRILVGKPENEDMDGCIILKWMLER